MFTCTSLVCVSLFLLLLFVGQDHKVIVLTQVLFNTRLSMGEQAGVSASELCSLPVQPAAPVRRYKTLTKRDASYTPDWPIVVSNEAHATWTVLDAKPFYGTPIKSSLHVREIDLAYQVILTPLLNITLCNNCEKLKLDAHVYEIINLENSFCARERFSFR